MAFDQPYWMCNGQAVLRIVSLAFQCTNLLIALSTVELTCQPSNCISSNRFLFSTVELVFWRQHDQSVTFPEEPSVQAHSCVWLCINCREQLCQIAVCLTDSSMRNHWSVMSHRTSDCKIMEVLRIITIYCCKVPGLQHFAWMHECGIYEVFVFFCK